MKFLGKALLVFSLMAVIAFCPIASFQCIEVEAAIILLIFSFLYGAINFQLNGSICKKVGMLAAGNVVGLFWNFIFNHFAAAGTLAFGEAFDSFYVLVFPSLNMLWIVTFWSFSMSYFSKTGNFAGR